MSGNTLRPFSRKFTVPFRLEADTISHFHDVTYEIESDELEMAELNTESALCDSRHIAKITQRMNSVLENAQPDSWDKHESYDGGRIVVRYGVTIWHAPDGLPYADDEHAFRNTFHEADDAPVDPDDPRVQARRNAYDDADEI